jgi:hypothetical protein
MRAYSSAVPSRIRVKVALAVPLLMRPIVSWRISRSLGAQADESSSAR